MKTELTQHELCVEWMRLRVCAELDGLPMAAADSAYYERYGRVPWFSDAEMSAAQAVVRAEIAASGPIADLPKDRGTR